MRLKTESRFGDLGNVFKSGTSELLNAIARLAVLYEDLRLELQELRAIEWKMAHTEESLPEYRVIYFLRRALSTLVEFRGTLTVVRKSSEFKQAEWTLTAMDAGNITGADRFLQQNWQQINECRNTFGAHIQHSGVEFATSNLTGVVGSVTWNSAADGLPMGLECDFAAQIVAGAFSSRLQTGADVRTEAQNALAVISEGFVHTQAAMCALVHAFLWNRFEK